MATVEGDPDEATLRASREGVELEDGRTAPARRNAFAPRPRRARRSTKAATARCAACSRPSATRSGSCTGPGYAGLDLDGLAPGEWRELRGHEVAALRAASAKAEQRAR